MKKIPVMLVLLCAFAAGNAFAEEEGVITRAGKGIQKGGEAAAEGIEKGAKAVEPGIKKGANAVGKGIEKGGEATAKGLKKAGSWISEKLGNESK